MKYKVGDIVKVRDDLTTDFWYANANCKGEGRVAVPSMLELKGREVRIEEVYGDGYKVKGSEFTWTDGMFGEVKKQSFDNWNAFINGKIAVICDTEEKLCAFLKECEKRKLSNRECGVGISLDTQYMIARYGTDTTIACNPETHKLGWCNSGFYKQDGYAVCFYEPTNETKPQSWKLIIEGCGDSTTAKYIEGKKVVASGSVKRYFKDEHSPKSAAHAVIEKVFSQDKKELGTGFTGKAVCKKEAKGFTVGKIYTFIDGITKDDNGNRRPDCTSELLKNTDFFKKWFEAILVALVE